MLLSEAQILILIKKLMNEKYISDRPPFGDWCLAGYRFEPEGKNVTILYMGYDEEVLLFEGKMSKYLRLIYHAFRVQKIRQYYKLVEDKEVKEKEDNEKKIKQVIDMIEKM